MLIYNSPEHTIEDVLEIFKHKKEKMPGLDKTGPMGRGALTGRTTGRCNQNSGIKSGNLFSRRGFAGRCESEINRNIPVGGKGPGRGFGRIWGKNRER